MEETIDINGTSVTIRGGMVVTDDGRVFIPVDLPKPDDN
ncbi:MAG: hypothetical protein RL291_64 [Pseudomonadota bacterium]|jgi:hypothetical protein